MTHKSRLIWLAILLTSPIVAFTKDPDYALVQLPGGMGYPLAINERGQIVGFLDPYIFHAVIWEDGSVIPLFPPTSTAHDINNRGQVVGVAGGVNVLWDHGTMIDLGEITPDAINDRGQIVGFIRTANVLEIHAALWENGTIVDLGVLPGDSSSFAAAINNRGVIIGTSSSGARGRAFIWDKGIMSELPGLDGEDTRALDINNRGQVVGYSGVRPVMWENDIPSPLETLPNSISGAAVAINNNGDIVGRLVVVQKKGPEGFAGHVPVIWENGKPVALPMFPPSLSFPNDYYPTDINNSGTIIGYQQRSERVVFPLVWVRNAQSAN